MGASHILRCVFLYKKKVEKRKRIGYDENGRFIGEMIENSIGHVYVSAAM